MSNQPSGGANVVVPRIRDGKALARNLPCDQREEDMKTQGEDSHLQAKESQGLEQAFSS